MEILFGYRYKTPDGFNGIVSKFHNGFVYMDVVSSWKNPVTKVVRKIKKYKLQDIKIFNESLTQSTL